MTITAKLGAGGMGEVYRAQDATLEREVAVKVLPTEMAADPERLERFQREARSIAALSHPNIVTIHSIEEIEGHHLLTMELVDGASLDEILPPSGFELDQFFRLGIQIADALAAAHDKGIVHRDLKPANVMVTSDGRVKILDFGLAKLAVPEPTAEEATELLTKDGMILGTVPYMSPEQIQGRPVDARSDIFSLGALLYEMATGRRPFGGDNPASVISAVLKDTPTTITAVRETLPNHLGRIVRRCLEKRPERRFQTARDVQLELEGLERELALASGEVAGEGRSDERTGPPATEGPLRTRTGLWAAALPWGLAALLSAVLLIIWAGRRDGAVPRPAPLSRWSIPLPPDTRVDLPGPGGKFDYSNTVAVSADGSAIAFSAIDRQNQVQLYLKQGDEAAPRVIPGTTNARAPFFSPDSRWLGFFARGRIFKVALSGGSPQEVCEVAGRAISFDASWAPDGSSIVYTDDGIWRVSLEGASPRRLTSPDPERGELGHHAPRFTSDGKSILFTTSGSGKRKLAVMPVDGTTWETLIDDAELGVPVGTDLLIFARAGELFAAPFDEVERRLTGTAVPALQGVHKSPGLGGMVLTWFDVSRTGTLVWVPAAPPRPDEQLVWVDLEGTETVLAEGPGTWVHPRLSPDGTRISLDVHTAGGMRDVHLYDLERRQFQQLTHSGVTWESEWRPDGEYLAILSGHQPGNWSLHGIRRDFSGPPELLGSTDHAIPGSWVDGGRALLYTQYNTGGVYRLELHGERHRELLAMGLDAAFPRVSPNGEWIAYVAEEASRREVFVRSYPDLGAVRKVSIDGGREPVWSRDGRRLFYRNDDQVLAVDVDYGRAISLGRPEALFSGDYDGAVVGHQHFDISLDDSRLLMVKHGEPSGPSEVRVALDWRGDLESLLEER